jgi:signal transduction histidine kinase/DNA-binding response OmpR family regulator
MTDSKHPAGGDVPARRAGDRSNASLERQNTALELESGELKAHQVTMERRADISRDLLAASVDENTALGLRSDELKAHQLILERRVDINRALLDASVDGIRLVDLEGRTLLANSVIEHLLTDLFGIPKGATLQEGAAMADRLTDPAPYLDTMRAIAADPECATKDSFEVADGGRAFERHTGPVRDAAGELIGRIIVLREITAEREADRLKDEAERLRSEIVGERDTAQLKSELVATVSHELRTPLTSVLGFAELMLHHDLDEDTRRRYLQTIHSEAQRLTRLIDDFLDLEKIEAGRFTIALEPFDLAELLQHEVELFAMPSASHRLELATPEGPLAMVGDQNRIGQVISNLLSNAIKYSPSGGTVTIKATAQEGFARVCVSDEGVGIPADQQAGVFTKFFRVDSSDTREIGGTGLGLALCQEIVAAHSGRIGFESAEGEGSTFWFEVPSALRAGEADSHARVLVIEDDPALAALFAEHLALEGLQVETVPTGELGLERALAQPPAMICLDVSLAGELDGWQVLTRLNANPVTNHIPVLVCTGENRRRTAAALGAAEFVVKPFTGDQLRQAVARILSADHESVLVVDDDEALRRLVVETLGRDGSELREAASGTEALAMIAAHQPDVLVLDLKMPGLDGFGVLDRLLESPETRDLPVVVLTGRDLSVSERRFLSERSASLLEKSKYSGDKLRRLVHDAPATTPARPAPAPAAAPLQGELTAELFTASRGELRRIATDIHNESIQTITDLGMRLKILQSTLTDPEQLSMLAELEQTVLLAVARLQEVVFDLAPLATEGQLATTFRVLLEDAPSPTAPESGQLTDDSTISGE